tara:strand:- start:336 stop:905 length:570 start_codon:yes stop_codon:yes gene_type:complete
MNENITLNKTDKIEKNKIASFGLRAGAYITDVIVLMLITLPLNYLNFINFKSFSIYLTIALIGILYKPLTEAFFGATLGKYALDLKVTDLNYNQISIKQSFLRSSILLIAPILYIPIQYLVFNNPELMNIEEFMDLSKVVASNYPLQSLIGYLSLTILIIDLVYMLTDDKKLLRSLHDRIGKTYVIKTK